MAEVEGNGGRQSETDRQRAHRQLLRRGDRKQLTLAHIELAMSDMIAVDRLLVLNQALTNVLTDDAGGVKLIP
jgi:hypothetical protein